MKRFFVTGGAGFIGSSMVDRLLAGGHHVVVYDNFSTGQRSFVEEASRHPRCKIVEADLLELSHLTQAMSEIDMVFHFAANADVRFGLNQPRRDLEQNTIATHNVLEAMRAQGVNKIAFSSTGSIYGEAKVIPTPEDAPLPIQTSLYGASKLAGEGLIQAYCEGYKMQSWIFRFVSILGERYTHGHVFDFIKRLLVNPNELTVLGNGKQRKSYLYINDCLDAIDVAIQKANEKVNIFNLGTDEYCEVNNSVQWICNEMNLKPKISHTGGERGWVGDNPFIFLDTKRIRDLGWIPRLNIQSAILKTVHYLLANKQLFEVRD